MILHPADTLARLPGPPNALWPEGARSLRALAHGSLELKLYAPQGHDPQTPHTRDEVYVVVAGHARFEQDGKVQAVAAGDAIFVPAGMPHRFVEFSDGFATWVMYYGPEGGEMP